MPENPPLPDAPPLDVSSGAPTHDLPRGLFDAQRLAAVLGHVPGFCYTVNEDLVFTSSEGAGLCLLELEPGEVVGLRLQDLWGTEDPNYEPLGCHRRALDGHAQVYRDVCLGRSLEYRLNPLRDEQGKVVGVIGVGIDVTEREQAREQEARLTSLLRQAQKTEAIGQLAGGIAHDFNNLLTCIMGNVTLAERALGSRERAAQHLVEANAAAESAASLTRQLLAFGRRQQIEPRPLDLGSLIGRVRGMLARLIGEAITLRTAHDEGLWSVRADPGQLEQVLVNLVVNARDAIDGHGEIRIETRNCELRQSDAASPLLRPGRYVVVTVRDSGRGMSEAVRAKLFEPFFTTKELGKGTGLGLATVYGAVRQNGGAVTVESELGKGSTFRVYLPRVDDAAVPEPASESTRTSLPGDMPGGKETILLVEDEPLLLELADCTLQQLGYQVLACAGADEALRAFAEHGERIDVLFTDVIMPRMNGKELAARLTAFRSELVVLFTSGYSDNILTLQGVVDAGVNYIAKPYRPAELAKKLRQVLDARRELGRQSA